ncbi:oxidoreductase : FAD dependent oxidoreductase OS=Desulfomicrobium baculatum (strain DSM 4028 / VKM B-1378) GN=Dbac_1184 PE=4 SV=1: DAO: Rieske [Gemmata massiliana]|uniref:Rieske domain-containing protein n=1 Tax=Gemmata massiliana TaxID=1210884 RepID=A0A6P2DGZ5_9BACT|nr:FAD-dependent oxidoreductase [Gemmata massiliana]VTS00298.1 oxidoreductase : FAD dependent oxidoreductase OS=Desulfomicrobium baculatum (strain DSM 4028 / VKM B-1378) GN=Dbac_1184 PE=4 SV=1: DAO: Rieske [Gemmata massiliana]
MPTTTSSVWSLDNPIRTGAPLAGNTRYDVGVIGGGIAGLTTAYLLACEGKSVVVLDAKPAVAGGETEFTTAHLAWVIDDRFARVALIRGDETARLAAKSHLTAIDLIEEIIKRENIACDFRRTDGYLFPGTDGNDIIRDEVVTLTRLGLIFERVDHVPFPAVATGPALRFPDNGQFHPLKYLSDIAGLIRKKGGVIHTDTQVVKVENGSPCVAHTKLGHTVTAGAIVIATNTPFDAGPSLHFKLAAYVTYAIALEVPAGHVSPALFWDTEDPYHYVRTAHGTDAEFLIVGGEDHKTGQAQDQQERWERLEAWARKRFPESGPARHHWSGQVFETPDGLGLIGRAPGFRDNLYVITGDSGMGMTHGTLGARLVSDLILGRTNEFAGVYSPSRWMPGALKTLLEENANLAAQYGDWLTGGEVKSASEIPNGHGAIIRHGLSKSAVYKDDKGQVHEMSAVCPHLGGIVQWNPGEKSWDCPCHGSRFSCKGDVQHGPAVEGLKAIEKT